MERLFQSLASLKLTVFVFLTIAVASLVGTLLPQGLTEQELQQQFGPKSSWFIGTLGLSDLYHTGWFRLLLLVLCTNLVVCTLHRLPKTLKRLRHQDDQTDPNKLVKFSCSKEIMTRIPWEEAKLRLTEVISEEFAPPKSCGQADTYSAVVEKGRWSPFMVYLVHFSVILILLGALLGSLFGFKGMMNLAEGGTSSEVLLYSGHESITLPFGIRCDDFDVSFYDTGAPKEFRSDLTVLENGQEVLKESIRVNDPLTYSGVTFYQSSYGTTLKQAEVELLDRETGKKYEMTLPYGETRTIPGTQDHIEIMNYQENLGRFGPALGIVLLKAGQQESTGSWILVKVPDFHGNRVQNYQVKVARTQLVQYTGLQVKRDPGVWLVWFGFVTMLVGICLTFYSSHRKLWIWGSPPSTGHSTSKFILAGRANKNSLAFEHEFKQIFERLNEALQPNAKGKTEHDS